MAADYAAIKAIHAGSAGLSIVLFITRGAWLLWSPQRLQQRWVRIVPHLIDTALLVSALWLAWHLDAGGSRVWLAAKVVALPVYILLGTVALKRGRTRGVRIAALIGAIATYGYIVTVALTKSPFGLIALI